MKTFLRLLILLIVVPAAVGSTLWFLDRREFFNLDHIDITLLKNNDQPRFMRPIVADLDKQFEAFRGTSLWRIDLEKISHEVAALPWVAEMQIRRSWPDRLEVKLKPKEVKFLFVGKAGQLFPVLDDGTFLNPIAAESLPDVVLLRGNDFVENKELLNRALKTLAEIPAEGSFSRKTISEIRYDQKEGFWATLMKGGVRVKIGEDQIATKSDRVSQVLDYLEANSFDGKVIDANLTKKVMVRLKSQ